MRLRLLLKTTALTLLLIIAGKVGWGATITSNAVTGNWDATTTWVGGVVPGASDDVIIADGAVVTININSITVASLTVGQGASGVLMLDGNASIRAITVTGNLTIATGGVFKTQKEFYTTGDVTTGSTTITNVSSTSGLAVGMAITGTGIPTTTPTTVTAFDATTITISAAPTATTAAASLSAFSSITATANTLAIGGDLTNNGTFDMSLGLSSYICNTTFNKVATSDQKISGTGTTTRFRGITLNRANTSDRILSSINVTINGSALFVFTKGTWEQSEGTLTIAGGNQTIATAGALIISGTASFSQTGSSLTLAGAAKLEVNTTGNFVLGGGNNNLTVGTGTTATINYLKGNVYINGKSYIQSGTLTIAGANVFIDPQVGTNYLSGGGNPFECSGTTNFTFSSGTVTLVDPLNAAAAGRDLKLTTSGTVNITNGVFYIGDGVSTTACASSTAGFVGFTIASSVTIPNLVIQTGGTAGRNVGLKSALNVSGTLTLTSGKLDIYQSALTLNNPIAGTTSNLVGHYIGTGGALTIAGTASNIVIPSSLDSLVTLTINNANGAALQGDLVVKTSLTLTNGKLDLASGNLKISGTGSISGANSSKYIVTSGTGTLKMNTNSTGSVTYPIGTSTTYTPFISTNNTSVDVLGANVHTPITNATLDNTRIVNLEWIGTDGTPGGNDGTITFTWNTADQAVNFDPAKDVYFGVWDGAKYTYEKVTVTGSSSPYTVTMNAPATYPTTPAIFGNIESFLPAGATLTPDATLNNVDNNIDITFPGTSSAWGAAISGITVNGVDLATPADYIVTLPSKIVTSPGSITLKPSGNAVLKASGTWNVVVKATGYADATCTQTVLPGAVSASKTAVNPSNATPFTLVFNTKNSFTITAKDQYENLVPNYVFKYDATITDAGGVDESYTINTVATSLSVTDVLLTATDGTTAQTTLDITIPSAVDPLDGISVQLKLNDGTSVGSAMAYTASALPSLSAAGTLNEATLNNATIQLTLQNDFFNSTFTTANYTLTGAPAGVTISGVAATAGKSVGITYATVTLAYDGTDFDTDYADATITVAKAELTSSATDLTSNKITFVALVETSPTVTSNATASPISYTTATLGGEITSTGGEVVTQMGLCYSATNATPELGGTGVSATQEITKGSATLITGNLTGLTPATKYYVRAYATNSVGTGYGAVREVTTLTPTITLGSITGTKFYAGNNIALTWTSTGVENVKIELYDGTAYSTILASTPASDNGKTVQIPSDAKYGTGYKVRISDASVATVNSESTTTFTVIASVANIAAFKALAVNDIAKITGEVVITFIRTANRNQKYVQDATGGILIDDPGATSGAVGTITTTYAEYDGITGLEGKLLMYGTYTYELTPTADPGTKTSSNNTITPTTLTLAQLKSDHMQYQSKLVKVVGVKIKEADGTVKFVTSSAASNYTMQLGTEEAVVRQAWKAGETDLIDAIIPTGNLDIIGIVGQFTTGSPAVTTAQLQPRRLSDITKLTGINEEFSTSLSVYPNPFTNEIRFTANQNVKRVIVSSIIGQVLKNVAIDKVSSINTEDLPQGIYVVTFMNGNGEKSTLKMIKQ